MMRWSDFHYRGARGPASYSKPATALVALRRLMGTEAFNAAWHKEYGADSYPDFMSSAGWDTMHAIFAGIKKLDGNVSDGMKFVDALKGWSTDGPRGHVMIDPETRDIVQDEHAMEVYRKDNGKLGVKVIGTTEKVKDQCKVLKLGRCGS